MTKLRLTQFLISLLDSGEMKEALDWEDKKSGTFRLLYYRVQADHRVFEAWNKVRCRKEQRKGSSKSFFNSALNYLKKNNLLRELRGDKKYRIFQFVEPANPIRRPTQSGLLQAVRTAPLSEVARLLNEGADVHSILGTVSPDQLHYNFPLGTAPVSALQAAVMAGRIDLLDILLTKGASLDGTSELPPPLVLAVAIYDPERPKPCYEIVNELLVRGADPNIRWPPLDRVLCSRPLLMACRLNDATLAADLLDAGASMNLGEPRPLTLALYLGSVDVAELLLDRNADPSEVTDGPNPSPRTFPLAPQSSISCFAWRCPLFMAAVRAAQMGNEILFIRALTSMLHPPSNDSLVPPPLIFIIQTLGGPGLNIAAISVRRLAEVGAELDSFCETLPECGTENCRHGALMHRTALFVALSKLDLEAVMELLRQGANPNLSGVPDRPPLCLALPPCHGVSMETFLRALLEYGADVNKSYRGVSPLAYLLSRPFAQENLVATSLLLQYGARVEFTSADLHSSGIFPSTPESCSQAADGHCLRRHIPLVILRMLLPFTETVDLQSLCRNLCQYDPDHLDFYKSVALQGRDPCISSRPD